MSAQSYYHSKDKQNIIRIRQQQYEIPSRRKIKNY